MSFPKYPRYKDSGVEWLGEVPEHWEVSRIKHVGRLKGGAGFPHDEQGSRGDELPFHKVNALAQAVAGVITSSENTISRESATRLRAHVFPPETIVFAKVGAALLLGRLCRLSTNACIDNNMMGLIVDTTRFFVRYLHYAMTTVRFDVLANPGAVPSLNEGQIGAFPLAMPPLSEQQRIALALDRETAKIDALIAEQQRLIELLKEKRQAVISHAVTKGLDPDAPMKPSGIEWLGDVPAHWNITKLKHVARFSGGGTPSRENLAFWGGDIPWVSPKDMKNESLTKSEESITELGLQGSTSSLIPAGTLLLVVRSGILKHTIPVAVTGVGVALNQDIKAVEFNPEQCRSDFFMRWVQGLNDALLIAWARQGATVESIEQELLANTSLPLPTIEEQEAIVVLLDEEIARLDTLRKEAERAITLLQERRTALITAAVTGKIDVRGLAEAA